MIRRLGVAAWLGLALAALFFYPIVAVLDSDIYYLQWRRVDLAEIALAIAIIGVVIGAAIFRLWDRTSRGAAIGLVAVASFPLASLLAGAVRQLPFDDALRQAWENPALSFSLPLAVTVVLAVLLWRWPAAFNQRLRTVLMAVSPISLVVLLTLARSISQPDTTVSIDRPSPAEVAGTMCGPVIALLFDEWSFTYLYENGSVRPEYPEIGRFAATATNHLNVRAAADETLAAVPSMLAARQYGDVRVAADGVYYRTADAEEAQPLSVRESDGLFATARALGYRTEMAGYYLAYCDLLGNLVDACRSMSFYNVGTASTQFSPLNPIRTTFVLWPRQFPFGIIKNPFFARFQRDLVEQTRAFVQRPIDSSRPVFRLAHFSIPHLPFVFTRDGFDPPWNSLRTWEDEDYTRQLDYVDRLVGDVRAGLEQAGIYDRATVVLLSDHGWRFGGGNEQDPLHVPFIVKLPGQRERRDVTDEERGELLLRQVVEQSCPAGR